MVVSKDHYYRLASNLPKERIQAASALISELSAADSEQDYSYALKRLISGLASGHDSARIGYSMCLTELLFLLFEMDNDAKREINYTSEKYLSDLESHLNKQIKAKQKGKNLRAYLFGKIFGIQSLINSQVLKKELESGNSQLIINIIDELFNIALSKSWIREISIVTMVKLITELKLATDAQIIPHILRLLSQHNLLVSMDGLLIYLTIPENQRNRLSMLAELPTSQCWKNNDPLAKGNLPLLKAAFQDRNVSQDTEEDGDDEEDGGDGVESEKKTGKKNGRASSNNGKNQKGSWNPQLHNAWAPLLNEVIENESQLQDSLSKEPSPKKRKSSKHKSKSSSSSDFNKISLSTFWPTFDETFFAQSASPERKHTGLQILDLCFKLPSFKPSFFLILFDENITRCIINHISKKDRVLHNLCAKTLANAVKSCKEHAELDNRLYLLRALEKECVLFDRVSKTKTVRDCLSGISSDDSNIERDVTNWVDIANWLINQAESELIESSSKAKNEKFRNDHDIKTFLLDALLTLIRGNKKLIKIVINGESKEQTLELVASCKAILEYLTKLVYLKASTTGAAEADDIITKTSKDRLQSILAELMECSKGQVDWSGLIVHVLRDAEKDNSLRTQIGESDELSEVKQDAVEIWEKLGKLVKKEAKENENSKRQARVNKCLVMLFSTALLELYGGDSESFGILSDLISVYNDVNNQRDSKDDNVLDVLIDLMLSYLTQQSGLKKRVGTYIWESVLYDVGEEQLERLFDVLMTRENKLGMEQLFNQGVEGLEDDGEEDEDEADEEEKEDDEEEEEEEEEDESDDEDDEDGGDDGEDELADDEKSKIEEVEKSATSALAKALNVNEQFENEGANSEKASNAEDDDNDDDDDDDDDDEDSESDESMSDEQMMALDSQLSAIFQQRKNSLDSLRSSSKNGNERKLEAQEARRLMALCKSRVLDLLDMYVNFYPARKEVVSIAVIGLDVMKLTLDLAVGEKAHKVIKKICKNVFKIESSQEREAALETLNQVLDRASKAKFNALSQGCSQLAIYLVRSVCAYQGENYEANLETVTAIYNRHMIKWAINSSDCSSSSLFIDLINWINSKRSSTKKD